MEEWAAKNAEARAALQAQRSKSQATSSVVPEEGTSQHTAASMDDDGGGSETNWDMEMGADSLFDDIPVGIREFMKTEKKLKQRHMDEQAANA